MSYEFTCDWFTDRVKHWPIHHLKDNPFNYLEIGSYEGRSILHIHDNIATHPKCKLVSVDPFPSYHDLSDNHIKLAEQRFYKNIMGKNIVHYKMDMLHYSMFKRLTTLDPCTFDLIYVDGSHLSFDCYTDAQLAWRLLNKGGIMILDDYELKNYPKEHENCRMGIDYFLESIKGSYQLLFQNWQVGIKKL
jgi:predicted O-methyltransferase YrrM